MSERLLAFVLIAPFGVVGCWLAWWAIKPVYDKFDERS
jgi:hypothetical protein